MAKQDKKVTNPTFGAAPGEDIFSRVAKLLGNALSTSTESWKNFGDVEKQAQIMEEYNKIKPLFGKEYRANRDARLNTDITDEDVPDEEKDNLLKRLFGNFKLKKLAKVDDKATSPLYQVPEKDEYNFMQSGDEPVDDTVVDPYSHAESDWAKRFNTKTADTKTADTKATDTQTDVTKTWADRFVKDDVDDVKDVQETGGTEGKFFKDKGRGLNNAEKNELRFTLQNNKKFMKLIKDAGFDNVNDFINSGFKSFRKSCI